MGKRRRSSWQVRAQVASAAARMLAEGAAVDFAVARRKAGAAHGVTDPNALPDLKEVEQAFSDYQSLFQPQVGAGAWRERLALAQEAMRHFEDFKPMLVGPILRGATPEGSAVRLHLVADSPEEVVFALVESGIPHELGERLVSFADAGDKRLPAYRFVAGETLIELVVMNDRDRRRTPVNRADGSTLDRAGPAQVARLLEESAPAGCPPGRTSDRPGPG